MFGFELSVIVGAYLLIVTYLATRTPRYVPGRTIYLFRALFPSWRFFEDVCELPTLYYRLEQSDKTFTPWTPCFTHLERSWRNILLNPQGNLMFAYGGLLHQLENDIELVDMDNTAAFANSVSYQLVSHLVQHHLSQLGIPSGVNYQFKVSSVVQGSQTPTEDNLISIVHQV